MVHLISGMRAKGMEIEIENSIELLGVHAEGEIGRVIISGAPDIPGHTMVDKMNHINHTDDSLMRICLYEPRGASQMTINLLTPACRDDADIGFFPMQPDGAHAMSGSNSICVTTALLEAGIIAPRGPKTIVRLDTPAGLIEATAHWDGKKVQRVEVDMPVSFVEHLDHPLEVLGLGTINVDVAFGGCYFAMVRAEDLGFSITPDEARDLVELGPGSMRQRKSKSKFSILKSKVSITWNIRCLLPVTGKTSATRQSSIPAVLTAHHVGQAHLPALRSCSSGARSHLMIRCRQNR